MDHLQEIKKEVLQLLVTQDISYKSELDKACLQYDMAFWSHKVLRDKAFNIARDTRYDGYQWGLASMVYKFFNKKCRGGGLSHIIKSIPQNEQLAEE